MKNVSLGCVTALLLVSLFFANIYPVWANSKNDVKIGAFNPKNPDGVPTRLIVHTKNRGVFGVLGKPSNETLAQSMDVVPTAHAKWVFAFGDYQVFDLGKTLTQAEYCRVASSLAALDGVVEIEEDLFITTTDTLPNDPWFADNPTNTQFQYSLKPDGYFSGQTGQPYYGINAPAAWDITTGDPDLNIAVLDTGIIDHTDLDGRWVGGYDFVTYAGYSWDGDGWDADPHDTSYKAPSPAGTGRWHGAHVAGTIAANTNNEYGVAGLNWNSKIVPVRVLGWGGGYISDALAGMEWAAGLPVLDAPANPNPARVMNLSFGVTISSCPDYMQNTIDEVYAAGGIIVVAAGNNNQDVAGFTPANCNHVITVAAAKTALLLDRDTSYSNYGLGITLTAPGTEIYSTTFNTSTPTDLTSMITSKNGTSMAAPHVTGVVSLMLSVRPDLTFKDVVSILKSSARAFPAGSWCATNAGLCGAGFLDAYGAVSAAVSYVIPTPVPTRNVFIPSVIR